MNLDHLLPVIAALSAALNACLGLLVSTRPPTPKRRRYYEAAFVAFGVIGAAAVIWAAFRQSSQNDRIEAGIGRISTAVGVSPKQSINDQLASIEGRLDKLPAAIAPPVGFRTSPSRPASGSVRQTAPTQRHLSSEERKRLISELRTLAPGAPGFVIVTEGTPEELRYAADWTDALSNSGFQMAPQLTGFGSESDRGLMVGMVDPDHPSPLATKFVAALRRAGFPVRIIKINGKLSSPADFDLFIAEP